LPHVTELLAQPARRAVRVVALARVDEIRRAYDRFVAGDADGLHDVRVGLRRARTWLQAFRAHVDDTLGKKTRRALTALARATTVARDAEVAAAWVRQQPDVPPRARAGFRATAERLEAERDDGLRDVRSRFKKDLPALLDALGRQLAEYSDQRPVEGQVTVIRMADAALEAATAKSERLARALAKASTGSDPDALHRTRIAAKRLRYVLEPLYAGEAGSPWVARLTELQDLLGDAHDMHTLARSIVKDIGEMAARDARLRALQSIGAKRGRRERTSYLRVRPGMIELARRAHARERAALRAFQKQWSADAAAEMLQAIPRDVAEACREVAPGSGVVVTPGRAAGSSER
jgi:CHAD domain-containing protein